LTPNQTDSVEGKITDYCLKHIVLGANVKGLDFLWKSVAFPEWVPTKNRNLLIKNG